MPNLQTTYNANEYEADEAEVAAKTEAKIIDFNLNEDQQAAQNFIFANHALNEKQVLLLGPAGTGKTFLMQSVAYKFSQTVLNATRRKARVVATAPTHKAVAVLKKKFNEAGLEHISCMTIHSLLGLRPMTNDTEKQVLKRNSDAGNGGSKVDFFDIVIIDEVSMVGTELQYFIDNDLDFHFVLHVGDAAQLPPVGEDIAPCFKSIPEELTFRLTKIVRQAEGNPILVASKILREQQGVDLGDAMMDYSWTLPAINEATGQGVFRCGKFMDDWLREAFTSDEFNRDNDTYRYIAYKNMRVKEINRKIRMWTYGYTETPFIVGERVVCRNTILNAAEVPIFATNEEAIVTAIEPDEMTFGFSMLSPLRNGRGIHLPEWSRTLPMWRVGLRRPEGKEQIVEAFIPQNEASYADLDRRVATQGKANPGRWREYYAMKEKVADLRHVYALTAHSAQGSTFKFAFLDVPDISSRMKYNVEETKKLFYVAVTRASHGVILTGI